MPNKSKSTVQPETSPVGPATPRAQGWRNPRVLAALLGAIAAIVVAYLQFAPKAPVKENKDKLTLEGRVYSKHSPGIEGAKLTLVVPGEGAITKPSREQGSFLFSDLTELKGTLTVVADGYAPKTLDITPLYSNQPLEIELIATADQNGGTPPGNKPDLSVARNEANEGWWFETGQIGAGPDYAAAMKRYLKAVDDGDVIANWNIARLYEHGLGVPKDLEKAKYWYKRAADQGDARSEAALNHLGENP